jgi:tyrosinase
LTVPKAVLTFQLQNVWSSINEPLFFLHHTQLDRIWDMWQSLRPQNFMAMGGRTYPNGSGLTHIDDPIEMSPAVGPDLQIRSVMDTQNRDGKGVLCYVYEHDSRIDAVKKSCSNTVV